MEIEWITVNGVTTYRVGGKEYRSRDELPRAARELLAELCAEGVLGESTVHERGGGEPRDVDTSVLDRGTTYEVSGKRYESLDDVPTEFRELFSRALDGADQRDTDVQSVTYDGGAKVIVDGKICESLEEVPPELLPSLSLEALEALSLSSASRRERQRTRRRRPGNRGADTASDPGAALPSVSGERITDGPRFATHTSGGGGGILGTVPSALGYLALVIWAHAEPGGAGPFVFVGFLMGDFMAWLLFTIWGVALKGILEFHLRPFCLQLAGFALLLTLLCRERSFDAAEGDPMDARIVFLVAFFVTMSAKMLVMSLRRMKEVSAGF